MPSRHRFVLTILLAELRASIRDTRLATRLWVIVGGGLLAAYAIGIFAVGAVSRADMLRDSGWVWFAAVPGAMLLSGAGLGWFFGRLASERAHAPFLKVQPLEEARRRGAARFAAHVLGAPLTALDGALVLTLALLVDKPLPVLWWVAATLLSGLAFAAAVHWRVHRSPAAVFEDAGDIRDVDALPSAAIAVLDRRRPAWLGSWAWDLPAGRVRLTARRLLPALALLLAGSGAVIASFVRQTASAGVIVGLLGGLGLFMLTVRFHPLQSPVLRASALGFGRAWLALMRLPLALSAAFFAFTAIPAYAAEPAAWQAPLAGAFGLLLLNGVYAVFAAFFAAAPKLAAFAFLAALALTAYESLEYSRTVFLGLAALVVFLWFRTRRSYRHG
ncbi:MAG: hypothetical protein KIT43_04560 [Bauldia sp.]|nr:hypothetical protein [Bauldia sp.]